MNFIFVLLVSVSLVASTWADDHSQFRELNKRFIAECKSELNAKVEDIAIMKSLDAPKNEIQSCLIDCVYTKLGVIKTGKLDKEGYQSVSKAIAGNDKDRLSKMNEVFETCSNEVNKLANQTCNVGKTMRKCLTEQFPDLVSVVKGASKPS